MTILCATDLLSRSDAAVERAGLLADALKMNLSILHVVPPLSTEAAVMDESRLAGLQLKARSRPPRWMLDVRPNLLVRTGEPADAVLETADDLTANLVVIGAHRRQSLRNAFKGSVAERLAESRRYPMLIVRRKPRGAYRKVVLALDLSQASGSAVRCAEAAGIFTDAPRCTILHACKPIEGEATHWRREYRNAITDMLVTASAHPSRYEVVLEEGRAASVILNHVRLHEPDLLIMGTRGGGKIHRALLGSVAREVTHQARCDVMLVPQGVMSARPSVTFTQQSRKSESLTASRGA